MTKDEALKLAIEALETPWNAPYVDGCDLALGKKVKAITAIKAALEAKDEPVGWKLMPRDATNAMLKAMDECAIEGYDERLPAGIASSVYMAAWDAVPQQKKISQKPLSLEWDEVFDAAASAYCRSEASRKALRLCFQSREQTSKISIGWTANELMDFAKTISYICVTEKTNEFNPDWDAMAVMVEEQQRMAKRIEELEAKDEPVVWNEGVPAMLPKQKEGETFIVSYEPKLEAKDEPVAWIWEKEDGYTSIETHSLDDEDMKNVGVKSIKPLYAKPQFIGLSEDEIFLISADCAASHQHTDIHFARAIEAKLKEKNQ